MKFTTRVQLLSLELGLLLPVTATAQPMQATPVVLRVSLFDDAGVGATTLREAAREASRIFPTLAGGGRGSLVETAGGKFNHGFDLFAV
jgi:hypothetical protein